MGMAMEEASELIKAICKLRRNGVTAETVDAEIKRLGQEIEDGLQQAEGLLKR